MKHEYKPYARILVAQSAKVSYRKRRASKSIHVHENTMQHNISRTTTPHEPPPQKIVSFKYLFQCLPHHAIPSTTPPHIDALRKPKRTTETESRVSTTSNSHHIFPNPQIIIPKLQRRPGLETPARFATRGSYIERIMNRMFSSRC